MNKIKLGLVLAGIACMYAVFAAPAGAFTEFRAKTGPTTIKAVQTGTHVFSIPGAASPVECPILEGTGKVIKAKQPEQVLITTYSNCKAFGSTATVSNAEYEFNANGTLTLLNTVTIKTSGCEDVLEPTNNRGLKAITYANVSGANQEIEVKANVSGITEKAPGGTCGESSSKATYKGASLVSASGVDLEVV